MKRFILITIGFERPTPEIMSQWKAWFHSIGSHIVEQVGLMNGKEITKEGIRDLPMDHEALTGYLVIEAEDLDAAIAIAQNCPMITSTRIYELRK